MTKAQARREGYLRNMAAMRQQQRRYIHITWQDRLWVWIDVIRHDPWHRFGAAVVIMMIAPAVVSVTMITNGFSELATLLTAGPLVGCGFCWLTSRG